MVLEIKPTAEDIEPEVSRPGLFISEPTPYGQKTHRRCRGRGVYPTEGSCRFPLIVLQQTTQSFLATHNSVIPACPSIRQGEQAHQSQGVPRLSFFLPETDFCFSYTSSSSGCMGNLPQKMNCRCTGLRKSAHLEWAEVDGPAQPPGVVDPGSHNCGGIPGTPPAIDYLFGSRLFGSGLFGSGLSSMLIITWYLIALDKATITLEVGRRASPRPNQLFKYCTGRCRQRLRSVPSFLVSEIAEL